MRQSACGSISHRDCNALYDLAFSKAQFTVLLRDKELCYSEQKANDRRASSF